MRAFCDPETTTSTPQASMGRSITPRLVMASTTRRASVRRTMPARAWMSWTAPVEVSLWVAKTALLAGARSRAPATAAGSTLLP